MSIINSIYNGLSEVRTKLENVRLRRRWSRLRDKGMHIGKGVNLPASTWIDTSHCHLIRIEDFCGFGEDCALLAHDAQMDEFIDAARIGRIVVHESCHIGMRTILLPSVEIGPKTIVWANSVVSRSLPSETVCAGNPAKVICSLKEYLEKHKERMSVRPQFSYAEYDIRVLDTRRRKEMQEAVKEDDAYIVGGRTAELRGDGGTLRTPFDSKPDQPCMPPDNPGVS